MTNFFNKNKNDIIFCSQRLFFCQDSGRFLRVIPCTGIRIFPRSHKGVSGGRTKKNPGAERMPEWSPAEESAPAGIFFTMSAATDRCGHAALRNDIKGEIRFSACPPRFSCQKRRVRRRRSGVFIKNVYNIYEINL